MKFRIGKFALAAVLHLFACAGAGGMSGSVSDHGVVAPVAFPVFGGHVAMLNADGERVIVAPVWTGWDEEGVRGSSFLTVNVENGQTMMTEVVYGDTAFGSFLSADNLLYFAQQGQLVVFDVRDNSVRKLGELPPRMPLWFTSDDQGRIYFVSYPNAELGCYDPVKDTLRNFGPLAVEDWPQYPRIEIDDQGWVYVPIRHKAANLIGFNPVTGERREYLKPSERIQVDNVSHYRATDGAVYIKLDSDEKWRRFHAGEMAFVQHPNPNRAVWRNATRAPHLYPDGSSVGSVDIPERNLIVKETDGTERRVDFDYDAEGARIYSLENVAGVLYGSTGLPPIVFRFDPEEERLQRTKVPGILHMNVWATQNGKLFGGAYSDGRICEHGLQDDLKEFSNVYNLKEARALVGRPYDMVAHPDDRHILMTGNPARGLAGGGLLVFNTETREGYLLGPDQLVSEQGTKALVVLPNGDIFGGTTTSAATGGTRTAAEAKLYRLSWPSLQKLGEWVPFAKLSAFYDLIVGRNGLVYGLTSERDLFAWNPETSKIVHSEKLLDYGENTGAPGLQTTNVMALGPDGQVYVLFTGGLVRVDPDTFHHEAIFRSAVPLTGSLTRVGSRFFFAAGAHLMSYEVDTAQKKRD